MGRSWAKPVSVAVTVAVIIAAAGIASSAAAAGSAARRPASRLAALEDMAAHGRARSETIVFGEKSVRVQLFRGATPVGAAAALAMPSAQIVRFGAQQVRIVRGGPATPMLSASAGAAEPAQPGTEADKRIQQVSFAGATVTVLRGLAAAVPAVVRKPSDDTDIADLFGPANGDELDRIAFAVEGVESSHGADLRMWRPAADGPQGPMQVSAAAALDVGGGDRFDSAENRFLGRAYLAQMFRRYGNWPDALKAYNWGPGNLDQWIAGGRDPTGLPVGVAHYVSRVLRDALMHTAAVGL